MAVHVACSRIGQPRRARCLVDTAVYLARSIVLVDLDLDLALVASLVVTRCH